ncbi:hypothetical protein [Mesorhizobium sp. 10J20-29]
MISRNDAVIALYRTDTKAFIKFAFGVLHPGQKLIWHWYLDVIADRVDAVIKGRTNRLIINAPPRTLKTLIATLASIALYLGRDPTKQVLLITGHPALANELMKRLRRLMGSDRYRSIFPHMRLAMAGTTIQTGHGGGVRSVTVGQQLSGHGADLVVIDDPLSPSHAADDHLCQEVNNWVVAEVLQRLNNRDKGAMVLVMQRVRGGDLSGHLESGSEKFESVVLPSIATDDEEWILSDGQCLIRKQGSVLNSAIDSPEKQAELWNQVGDFVYATQYLQDTCGSTNGPRRFLFEPKGPNWTPENSHLRGGLYRLAYQYMIMHRAFGHPLPEHAKWLGHSPLSLEEWTVMAVANSRRLQELHSAPDRERPT